MFIGIYPYFTTFSSHLTPRSSGVVLGPFLAIVETVSSLIRPLSLAFRIAANITAGHVILGLVSSGLGYIVRDGIYTLLFIGVGYILFESLVCLIQAYVFVLLVSIYSNDYIL